MRNLVQILFFINLLVVPVVANDPIPGFYQGTASGAFEAASQKRQIIMIDFYTATCSPCKLLEKNVYRSSEFRPLTESLICYTVNAEEGEGITLAERYAVNSAYPTVLFVDASGHEIERMVGYSEDGSGYMKEIRRIVAGKDILPQWLANFSKDHSSDDAGKIARYYMYLDVHKAEPYCIFYLKTSGVSEDEQRSMRIDFARAGLRERLPSAVIAAEQILASVKGSPDFDEADIALSYASYWLNSDKERSWNLANDWFKRFEPAKREVFQETFDALKSQSGHGSDSGK